MKRVTKNKGTISSLEPNAYCPYYYPQIMLCRGLNWRAELRLLRFLKKSLHKYFINAGLTNVRYRKTGFMPPVFPDNLIDKMFKVNNLLSKSPLALFSGYIFVNGRVG